MKQIFEENEVKKIPINSVIEEIIINIQENPVKKKCSTQLCSLYELTHIDEYFKHSFCRSMV